MKKSAKSLSRREMLKNVTLLGVAGTISPSMLSFQSASKKKPVNRIVEENSKPGTLEWQLQYTRFDDPITLASYPLIRNLRSSMIEGFASKTSVAPGDSIDFMVSTNPAARYIIDIYRTGYYGGLGGRHMTRLELSRGSHRPYR
jgi:hypothetical protein